METVESTCHYSFMSVESVKKKKLGLDFVTSVNSFYLASTVDP